MSVSFVFKNIIIDVLEPYNEYVQLGCGHLIAEPEDCKQNESQGSVYDCAHCEGNRPKIYSKDFDSSKHPKALICRLYQMALAVKTPEDEAKLVRKIGKVIPQLPREFPAKIRQVFESITKASSTPLATTPIRRIQENDGWPIPDIATTPLGSGDEINPQPEVYWFHHPEGLSREVLVLGHKGSALCSFSAREDKQSKTITVAIQINENNEELWAQLLSLGIDIEYSVKYTSTEVEKLLAIWNVVKDLELLSSNEEEKISKYIKEITAIKPDIDLTCTESIQGYGSFQTFRPIISDNAEDGVIVGDYDSRKSLDELEFIELREPTLDDMTPEEIQKLFDAMEKMNVSG